MASMTVDGTNGVAGAKAEEPDVDLPAHACA
jgi:hypothetical protein